MEHFSAYTPMAFLREANTESSNARVLRGVTIIKSGLGNRRDKRLYTTKAIREAVKAGLFDNLRAFVDHPSTIEDQVQPERSVRDLAGIYKNPKYVQEGDRGRVVADLHILEPHAWVAKGIRELASMGLGDKIGISILGSGVMSPAKYREANGNVLEVAQVDQFKNLRSADIVTQAGAGGGFSNLLESAGCEAAQEHRDTIMTKAQILSKIAEAATAGDEAQVSTLTAQLADAPAEEPAADADADPDPEVKEGDPEDAADGDDEGAEGEKAKVKKTKEAFGGKKAMPFGKKTKETKEAVPGAGNKSGSCNKPAKMKGVDGQKFGEAEVETTEDTDLREAYDALVAENTTLKAQARARETNSYIARKLKESKLPEKSRTKLYGKLAQMGGETAEIDAEIAFQEALFEDSRDAGLSKFEEVEGAGGSGAEGTGGSVTEKFREAMAGAGLKCKAAKK